VHIGIAWIVNAKAKKGVYDHTETLIIKNLELYLFRIGIFSYVEHVQNLPYLIISAA